MPEILADLTESEKRSPIVAQILKIYEARLRTLRLQNDGDMDSEKRWKHLGRIAEVKLYVATLGGSPDA